MIKRLFDITFSLWGLIILSPIFAIVSFAIKKSSPGPVFFKGERIGKNGVLFKMLKFRTMVVNADKMGGPSTASDDPRLTKIGLVLKKYQLDELPQLINVFMGQMSLVGPRPDVSSEIESLDPKIRNIILSVKPGMTSLATLENPHEGEVLKGSEDPHRVYCEKIKPEKIRLNLKYVKERSVWLDMRIIFKTFFVAIFK